MSNGTRMLFLFLICKRDSSEPFTGSVRNVLLSVYLCRSPKRTGHSFVAELLSHLVVGRRAKRRLQHTPFCFCLPFALFTYQQGRVSLPWSNNTTGLLITAGSSSLLLTFMAFTWFVLSVVLIALDYIFFFFIQNDLMLMWGFFIFIFFDEQNSVQVFLFYLS